MIFLIWNTCEPGSLNLEKIKNCINLKATTSSDNFIFKNIDTDDVIDPSRLVNSPLLIINDSLESEATPDHLIKIASQNTYKVYTINVQNLDKNAAKSSIKSKVIEILEEIISTSDSSLKAILKSEAALRKDYTSLKESFAIMEEFVYATGLDSFEQKFSYPPTADQSFIELTSGSTLSQRLPCNSIGFASVSFQIYNFKDISEGHLQCKLLSTDDEIVHGEWLINLSKDIKCKNKYTLTLPKSLGPEEKTLELQLSWEGKSIIKFRSSFNYPNDLYLPSIRGFMMTTLPSKKDKILSLEMRKILPNLTTHNDLSAILPSAGENNTSGLRTWRSVPLNYLKNFNILDSTSNPKLTLFDQKSNGLRVHVQPDGKISSVILKEAIDKKVKRIKCKIKTLNKSASPISYQIIAQDFKKDIKKLNSVESDWVEIDPMVESEITINLSNEFNKYFNLVFRTKLSSPATQSDAYGWSTFYDLMFYI